LKCLVLEGIIEKLDNAIGVYRKCYATKEILLTVEYSSVLDSSNNYLLVVFDNPNNDSYIEILTRIN
jgi:hypothetical protein